MLINGKQIAEEIYSDLLFRRNRLKASLRVIDIVIGDNPVSLKFAEVKSRAAHKINIDFQLFKLSGHLTSGELMTQISGVVKEAKLTGCIIQLPIPKPLPEQAIVDLIPVELDVDIVTTAGLNKFYADDLFILPPTAAAILKILEKLNEPKPGSHVVILGQGKLVGKPVAFLLKRQGCLVHSLNSKTPNSQELIHSADVLITATGKPGLVKAGMLKPGCVVIDAGTSEQAGSLAGDVDAFGVEQVAKYYTPVPGGVGPVTVAMLMQNVITLAEKAELP